MRKSPKTWVKNVEALGAPPWPTRDPFLFCVYHADSYPEGSETMGPATSLAGRTIGQDFAGKDGWRMYHGVAVPGFPQHPHRGFETVTVVRQGLVDHSDSLGATARYGQGDTQWLTAGGGIQHAEMFPLVRTDADNPLELFQIWLNLPQRNKMVPAHFKMLWADSIPRQSVRDDGGRETELVSVAGSYGEFSPPVPPPNSWASQSDSHVAIWTLKMEPQARFKLPSVEAGVQRALYFFAGDDVRIGDRQIGAGKLIDLVDEVAVELENGAQQGEYLLLQGMPIGEPVAHYGPFVMNTRAELQQAISDYQRTRFGGWPWPNADPVHARDQGRFARHADGREELPD